MPQITQCHAPEALQGLLLGQVAGPDAERLTAHLEACERCAEVASRLRGDDFVVLAVRNPQAAHTEEHDPVISHLIHQLLQAGPPAPSHHAGAAPHLERTHHDAGDVTGLLAPAESEGELGRLGNYRVLRVLGQGGMGVVLHAEDPELRRPVALKVMRPTLAASPSARRRFLREGQAAAAIRHDHVVPIYHVGEDRGVPFLAMPLLEGEPLEDRLRREGRLSSDEVLRIGREIALGLAAAHDRGLVHRDVKPGNVWLETPSGEPGALAPGARVKLLDFGLARAAADDERLTLAGAIVGTPAFMSPEQVDGRPVDARGDLFSLGCVMYLMATGQQPFRGPDLTSTLLSVTTCLPARPDALVPGMPPALSALVLQLLAKSPEDRPASANAVIEMIAAIEADPTLRPQRLGLRGDRAGRIRMGRAALAVALAGALVALVYAIANRDGKGVDAPGPIVPVVDAPPPSGGPGLAAPMLMRELAEHSLEGILGVRLSPDGSRAVTVSADKMVRLWDVREHRQLRCYRGHLRAPRDAVLSPDGTRILSGGDDRVVRLWDVATGRQLARWLGHDDRILAVALSPDGTRALSASGDKTIRLWKVDNGELLCILSGHSAAVMGIAFAGDGTRCLSCSADDTVRLWDLQTGHELRRIDGTVGAMHGAALLPDSQRAITLCRSAAPCVWDLQTGNEVRRLEGGTGSPGAVHVSSDGQVAFTIDGDKEVHIWDVATGQHRQMVPTGPITSLAPAANGRWFLAAESRRTTLREWRASEPLDAETVGEARRLTGHGGAIKAVTVSPEGRIAYSAGSDHTIRVWDLEAGKELSPFAPGGEHGEWLCLLRDGRRLLSRGLKGGLWVRDVETGQVAIHLDASAGSLACGAVSDDGRRALTGGSDRMVYFWDLDKGKKLCRLQGHTAEVSAVALSPDGRRALSGGADGTVRLWDLEAQKELRKLLTKHGRVDAVAFSPDGHLALSHGSDSAVVLAWDVLTGSQVGQFVGHGEGVRAIAPSPEGARFVTGGLDGTIRLWDLRGQTALACFAGHTGFVSQVALCRGGRCAVSAGDDGTVRVWRLPDKPPHWADSQIQRFVGHTARSITAVAFAPDGKQIVSADFDGVICFWDCASGRQVRRFRGHTGKVTQVAFTGAGEIISCGQDGHIALWSCVTGKLLHQFEAHPKMITAMSVSADGRKIVTAGLERALRLWSVAEGKPITGTSQVPGIVLALAFAPDGNRFLAGSEEKLLRLVDVRERRPLLVMEGHEDLVTAVAVSPDGSRAASGSVDCTVRLWDLATGRELVRLPGHGLPVLSVVFTPDGRRLISGSSDGTTRVWDARTGRELHRFDGPSGAVACSPDGKHVLVGGGQQLRLLALPPPLGEVSEQFPPVPPLEVGQCRTHLGWPAAAPAAPMIYHTAVSPDAKTFVAGDSNGTLRLWDVATGRRLLEVQAHKGGSMWAVYTPDGQHVLSAGSDKTVRLWDIATGKQVRAFTGHSAPITTVDISTDGKRALSGSDDGTLRLWELDSGKEVGRLLGHKGWCQGTFAPGCKQVVSWGDDRTLRRWDAITGKELAKLPGTWTDVRRCAFSPNGGKLIVLCADHLRHLDWPAGKELGRQALGKGIILGWGFSGDRRWLLVRFDQDEQLRLWDLEAGEEVSRLLLPEEPGGLFSLSDDGATALCGTARGQTFLVRLPGPVTAQTPGATRLTASHRGAVRGLAVAPDAKTAFSAGDDARRWSLRDGQELAKLPLPSRIDDALPSPDGRRVALLSIGAGIWVVDAATGKPLWSGLGKGTTRRLWAGCWAPDSRRLLTGGENGVARLWDIEEGKLLLELGGHSGRVGCVAISPDGTHALTGGENDCVLRMWDLKTAREQWQVPAQLNGPGSACITPDGQGVLSCGTDSVLRLFDAATAKEKRRFLCADGSEPAWHRLCVLVDGRYFLAAGADNVLRLWSIASGKEVFRTGLAALPTSLAVMPDGTWALVGTEKGHVIRVRLPQEAARRPGPG